MNYAVNTSKNAKDPSEARRGKENSLAGHSEGACTLPQAGFPFLALMCKRTTLCLFKPSGLDVVMAAPGN